MYVYSYKFSNAFVVYTKLGDINMELIKIFKKTCNTHIVKNNVEDNDDHTVIIMILHLVIL